jgi:hypothetical protein
MNTKTLRHGLAITIDNTEPNKLTLLSPRELTEYEWSNILESVARSLKDRSQSKAIKIEFRSAA